MADLLVNLLTIQPKKTQIFNYMFVGFKVFNGECTENFKNQNIETAACISFFISCMGS